MPEQTSACIHEYKRREYYRDGLYKCWECGNIIEESPKTTYIQQQQNDSLEDFKMSVNKLSYVVNNVGINNSFDRTLARNTIDEVMIAFNTYIKTLINE